MAPEGATPSAPVIDGGSGNGESDVMTERTGEAAELVAAPRAQPRERPEARDATPPAGAPPPRTPFEDAAAAQGKASGDPLVPVFALLSLASMIAYYALSHGVVAQLDFLRQSLDKLMKVVG